MRRRHREFGRDFGRRSLGLLLAVYLAIFTGGLPALHTCAPHIESAGAGSRESQLTGPQSGHPDDAHSADDLCFVCRLTGDSGGILPPLATEVADPAACHERPAASSNHVHSRRAHGASLPRAPPA